MINAAKIRWDSTKDAWLIARLHRQSFINWAAVAAEFQKTFHISYPVGRLIKRWRGIESQFINMNWKRGEAL